MFNLVKWGILSKVLPWTGLFCIVKLGMHWLDFEPWAFDALTGALFSAATFVIALILSGTLTDYRACEGMPSQIANALETIKDTNHTIAARYPDYQPQPLQQALTSVSRSILDWLKDGKEFTVVDDSIDRLNPLLAEILVIDGCAGFVNYIQSEQAKIRSISRQMCGNRDTEFLGAAYVLLWLFLGGSIVALLLIDAERFSENLTVSTFMFTLFVYLLFLIEDLDNPFQYDGKSSVDVGLSPLENVCLKLTIVETPKLE
ncbi:hypothetical protein [Chamaesiphon sp. VAR_48_metabat_135_sub]|uniref:hypothetical protein n=1 Tax=Chamaesiphon sp. VAR_48_metabat_135_sub TaxID=2964699 RepID=UPI00286B0D79|nr:hypothetical protein [Chamaesiphon sp. VAR_48_metabat_135_sub]